MPGAWLVEAFHVDVGLLPEPEAGGGRRVLFLSGDEPSAKAAVADLVERLGMHPVDLGSLPRARPWPEPRSGPWP